MTRTRAARVVLGFCLLAPALSACESSQEKSARIQAKGDAAFSQRGVTVRRANTEVKVLATKALKDANGAAAVVVVRSAAPRPLIGAPVSIDVRDRAGRSVFKNDDPGLEASLVGPSVIPPGRDVAWVHDQVVADGPVAGVKAVVGTARRDPTGPLPEIDASTPRLEGDPTSGVAARGTVVNRSKVDQRDLVAYCVARRGGRIVAAGRGGIPRLAAGKRRRYEIFFIGDPRGASLTLEVPPTVFK